MWSEILYKTNEEEYASHTLPIANKMAKMGFPKKQAKVK